MGRPCEFDRASAIAEARRLFLEKGYGATSIDDLTTALGISRASLYNSFGDKRGLLLEAFHCAEQEATAARAQALSDTGPARDAIRAFLERVGDVKLNGNSPRGCFFLTLGAELSGSDEEVRERVEASLEKARAMFTTLLKRARLHGEIAPKKDLRKLAAGLVGAMVSLQALARVHPDRKLLAGVVEQAMASLD